MNVIWLQFVSLIYTCRRSASQNSVQLLDWIIRQMRRRQPVHSLLHPLMVTLMINSIAFLHFFYFQISVNIAILCILSQAKNLWCFFANPPFSSTRTRNGGPKQSPSVKTLAHSCESLSFLPEAHHKGAMDMQLLDQPSPYFHHDNHSCVTE